MLLILNTKTVSKYFFLYEYWCLFIHNLNLLGMPYKGIMVTIEVLQKQSAVWRKVRTLFTILKLYSYKLFIANFKSKVLSYGLKLQSYDISYIICTNIGINNWLSILIDGNKKVVIKGKFHLQIQRNKERMRMIKCLYKRKRKKYRKT